MTRLLVNGAAYQTSIVSASEIASLEVTIGLIAIDEVPAMHSDRHENKNVYLHDSRSASEYLLKGHGVSLKPRTLANMRVTGAGPEFQYLGDKPVYTEAGLDKYVAERLSPPIRSTTEGRALAQAS